MVLKYTLTTDDKEEHLVWLNGGKYLGIIEDLRNWIRSELKYNPKLKEHEAEVLVKVREKLNELENEE
jgi:hypothetical protein